MGGQAPPDAATRARSGRPAGGRRSRGCPDAGHAGRRPVRVRCPPCGRPSNRSSRRPVSTRPVSTRPVSTRPVSTRPVSSRCPDGRASGVRGSAAALSAPRWILNGSVRRAILVGRNGCDVPPWSAGGVVACPHGPEGKRWCWGWPWVAGMRVASRLGRRLTRPQAAVPLAAWPTMELVQRQGAGRLAGGTRTPRCSPASQVRPGAGCRHGARPWGWTEGVVTTLRGRWAGDGPVSSVPESPSGSAGSRLRPQRGRGT